MICWVSVFLLEAVFVISPLSGATIPVGFSICCLGQSSCWEDIFLMNLLSGANISVGFVISFLGFSLLVGKTFS